MRFCFKLACGPALAAALYAGAAPDTGAERQATVVRANPRTGKLVRVALAPPARPGEASGGEQLKAVVERIAGEQSLPPALLHSVIQVESNYNPNAVSPKGAQGLMQLVPATARRFGVADAFDPVENIRGGAAYLKYLLGLYGGNYTLALAAYNAGEGAVARYGDVPPYRETRDYVKQVAGRLAAQAGSTPAAPAEAKTAAAPAGPSHIEEVVEADGSVRYVTR
jgi:soluble lytic murein transglycosylase-like protein